MTHARRKAVAQRKKNPKQAELVTGEANLGHSVGHSLGHSEGISADHTADNSTGHSLGMDILPDETDITDMTDLPPADAPISVTYRFAPLQLARFEAITEKIYKSRIVMPGISREDLLLMALETLLNSSDDSDLLPRGQSGEQIYERGGERDRQVLPRGQESDQKSDQELGKIGEIKEESDQKVFPRGKCISAYKIIIYKCEICEKATVQTNWGIKEIANSTLQAAECDAEIERAGKRNQATITPSVRRAVLSRDKHQCQAPGCHNRHFLEVHHRKPRRDGGSNKPENLLVMCSRCHKLWHEKGLNGAPFDNG